MIDPARIFHTGFLVENLETAMAVYGEALGATWATPACLRDQAFWSPAEGNHTLTIEVTYSVAGPHHIEIQRGPAGSFYDPVRHGAHHVGLWCDDLSSEVLRLQRLGWRIAIANAAPEDGFGIFAYLEPPFGGLLVELVSPLFRPMLESWLRGESVLGQP